MPKRSLPIMIAVLLLLGTPPVRAYDTHIEEVINTPTVTYRKAVTVDAPLDLWNRVLDNPCLMGRIWEIYEFTPLYRVTKTDPGIRVSDPSGINGDIRQVDRSDRARVFFARGSFDHWAVPSFFTASGVVILEYTPGRDIPSGEIAIFLRGNNGISRFVMSLFSGILTRRIGNRVDSTLENMGEIVRDIAHGSRKIRESLSGRALDDFDRVFPETKVEPVSERDILFDLQSGMHR